MNKCTNCGTYKAGLLDESTVCPVCEGSGEVAVEEAKEEEFTESSYQELKAKAKELGIKVKVTFSREDLEEAIAQAEAEVKEPVEQPE